MRHLAARRVRALVGMVLAAGLVVGCGSGGGERSPAGGRDASWPTVTMIAFSDQWASAQPRYFDIADLLFHRTLPPGTIQFRYDPSPSASCLVGEIKGWDLKPNFCYQLKLVGKPGAVSGGLWGAEADMATNAAILTNARWWNYRTEDPAFTTTNAAQALASQDYADGWVAGYVYFGYVMTDENGLIKCYGGATAPVPADASGWVPVSANRCYHITGKTGQGIGQDTTPIAYTLARTSYGYDTTASDTISLWYEKEPDNPLDFALPGGDHDVVLMVTEESFHNNLGGGTNSPDGGYWDTVWVSDWSTGLSPKTGSPWTLDIGGPINFTTAAVNVMTYEKLVQWLGKPGKYQANAIVTVMANGAPLPGATVTGYFSGAFNSRPSSQTTGADGKAVFYGPPNKKTAGALAFTVTNIVKSGYTWQP